MARLILLMIILSGVFAAFPVAALSVSEVPEPLKPWVNWVLQDETQWQCPFFQQDFQQKHCAWPGPLKLDLQAKQGRFSSSWTLYQPDWVILPGDSQHWPQQVQVNQQAAVVLEHDGKPAIHLTAGHYQISGEFIWEQLPESLTIDDAIGLIQLTVDGQTVTYPQLKEGALWLSAGEQISTAGPGGLDIQVFRQVIDDVPLQVITRLELQISGPARELRLPHALLPGFIPISLQSALPARIEADGGLLLQARPGRWSIAVHGRHPQALQQLDLSINDASWPQAEIWVLQAMPELRLVEVAGVAAIDGSQTNLPADWQSLPAYQVKQGEAMQFKLIRRGDPEPQPNQLHLSRQLWLDFDGTGYTVSDKINGSMSRDWRLNTAEQLFLGQVRLNGQNQLITQADAAQGVEVRRGAVDLSADSRILGDIGTLNAVGWQQSFQQVQAELNIPPGWRLLAVSGVDNDPGTWLTRWTLLDLFLVLIAAAAVSRLWSPVWGALALLSLALIWHEADAPRWIWLNILAALALLRVLPAGRLAQWLSVYRYLCWLALVVLVIPFMINQIRIGIYPQLQQPWQAIVPEIYGAASAPPVAAPMAMAEDAYQAMSRKSVVRKSLADNYIDGGVAVNFSRIDPDANVQTGPGLPQWHWQTLSLSWNGAVNSQQQIRLWYLSPTANLLLHLLQALLTALLSLKLLGVLQTSWRLPPSLLSVLLLPLLAWPTQDSYADLPDPALLEQLKARLLKAPECLPSCAQIPLLRISAKPDLLRLELQVHAQNAVAVPLPAQWQQWFPEQVTVDGSPAQGLIRQNDGSLWLNVATGVHQVMLQGRYATHGKFSLPLTLTPQLTQLTAEGWRVDGLYDNGKTATQLEFNRLAVDKQLTASSSQQASLPPLVRVERLLNLGLDWHVTTRVERLAASDTQIVLELPLLPGEAVTDSQVHVKDGKVLVNIAAGQNSLEWQSLLQKTEQLQLQAPDTAQWTEVWRADVSPIWHVALSGIAVVHHQDSQGVWLPEWRPWPGESVQLTISRPQPVAGATITIDNSQLQLKPGKRSEEAELKLTLRSSKAAQHTLTLPEQAVLLAVTIDGVSQPIRQKAASVTLPIHPGEQQIQLNWQTAIEQVAWFNTPAINLGLASVNSHLQVLLAEDRWVLFTLGPQFGPAALIWGLLIVLLLLAVGLGKVSLTPIKHWQWFLLLLGLSQIHILAALLVVTWLLALGLRARVYPARHESFNLLQVVLAGWTLLSLVLLFVAVQQGLLGAPDMQIVGNQSSAFDLNWYQDRTGAALPTALVVSVPMFAYRMLMLGWSLWMAVALLDWLRWGWGCYSADGIWKKTPPKNTANES